MVTRFGTYCRTLLAGSLVFAGAAAVSVVGGSLSASPAAAATPTAWTAYVVSYNDDAVIPVNTATDAVGAPITVGSGPSAIAITPDATTAYVTDEGTTNTAPGFVTPIDLSTNTPGTPIPVGSGPDAIAITPNGLTAYVGNYNDDTVTPINLVTNTAGTPIPVGAPPTSITITPDGSTAYVSQGFRRRHPDRHRHQQGRCRHPQYPRRLRIGHHPRRLHALHAQLPRQRCGDVSTRRPMPEGASRRSTIPRESPSPPTAPPPTSPTPRSPRNKASLLPIDTATSPRDTDHPGHQFGRSRGHHPRRRPPPS